MINDNIFNIFCFSTFSIWYFLQTLNFDKFSRKQLKKLGLESMEKKKFKTKKIKMKKMILYETPKLISAIFGPLLAIFTLFHLKFLQLCKIFPSYIYGTPQVMFGLVNNHGKWCQMSCIIFHDWTFLVGMCVTHTSWTLEFWTPAL